MGRKKKAEQSGDVRPNNELTEDDPKQMDLKDRKDSDGDTVMVDLPSPDVSAPPFAMPDAPPVPQ